MKFWVLSHPCPATKGGIQHEFFPNETEAREARHRRKQMILETYDDLERDMEGGMTPLDSKRMERSIPLMPIRLIVVPEDKANLMALLNSRNGGVL